MKTIITIKPEVLQGMLLIAAKNDIRYYLNGMNFEVKEREAIICCTNGHYLGVYHHVVAEFDENMVPATFIVPRDIIEKIKGKSNINAVITYDHESKNVSIYFNGTTFSGKAVEGTFPDYSRVIPSEATQGEPGHYNHSYLERLDKAVQTIHGNKNMGCHLIQRGTDGAIALSAKVPEFIGVVMPIRKDDITTWSRPEWLKG